MNTRFRESFAEDLAALTEARLLRRIQRVIEQVEAAATFQQIANLKRLETRGKYYHIRVGNYRVGLVFEDGAVTFVRCLDRKEITATSPEFLAGRECCTATFGSLASTAGR